MYLLLLLSPIKYKRVLCLFYYLKGIEGERLGFCKQCGNKLEEGQKFCKNCGSNVKSDESSITPKKESYTKKTFKMKKGTKIGIFLASFIAICLYIGYYFVAQTLTPHAISQGFISAIKEKDVAELKSFINDGQVQLEVTDEEVESYLSFIEENPDYLNQTIEQLEKMTTMYENGENREATSYAEINEAAVNLKKSGKKWLLFDHYVVEVSPVFIVVTTDTDETTVSINNEKVGTIHEYDEKKYGPYLPGEYVVKMTVDGGYGAVEMSEEVSSSSYFETKLHVDAYFADQYVSLYTNDEDAILFVNGKSTAKTIAEIGELGPINIDGSIELYAERATENGKERTEVVVIEEDTYSVDLYFEEVEEVVEEVVVQDELETKVAESESDVANIEQTIYDHYDRISSGDFSGAYSLFTSSKRSAMSESGWTEALKTTILDEVTYVNVEEINKNEATASIHMTSYDKQEDGTTLVQYWEGKWLLVKENGSWYLDKAKLEVEGSDIQ